MSLKKIIDLDLLGRFLDKVKALIPTKTSELENDAGFMAGMTILSYGSSTWADFIAAYGDNKVVYCRASSNSNPASGSQTRLAFMAYVNNATTPTEVEFQYYRSVNAHTDSQQGDQVYVYKLNKNSGWSVTVRNAFSKVATGTGLTHTYSNGTITLANSETVPGVVSTAADGLAPQLPDESTTTKFLRQDATWAVPPDTTYESKAAASGGTDVSLVTTGEKYIWNTKGLPSGGSAGQVLKKSSATDYSVEWGDASGAQMVVAVTRSGSTVSANKSFSELYSAYQNGSQIIAFYGSEQNIYMLNKVGSSLIEFVYTDVISNGTTQYLIRITSGNVVNVYQNHIPSPPAHANSNPIFVIYLDKTETPSRYRIDFSQYDDISYFFGTDTSTPNRWDLVTLQLWNSGKNSYADPIENADYYEFKLTHAYTTSSTDEYGNASYVGHLIFSAIAIENGQKKLKTFELVSNFDTYEYLDDATITYSEEILGSGGTMPVNAAVIHVNAPLGSAITFLKDSTVMEAVTAAQTHPNADGKTEDYYYSVPTSDFGSWTVAASKSGENDATQSFSILVAKQYDAILSYLAPYDFQAIEWLQTSSAPCYFDTGIDITTSNIQTEVYCETVGYSQDYDLTLFGTALGYAVMANGYRKRWSFSYCTSNSTDSDAVLTYTYTEGTDYHLIYNALGGSVILDDVNVAGSRDRRPKNTNYPRLYIGRYYNPSNGNYYYGQWRYKRFIVSNTSTGEILADFQPCYRKADHVIGFWDHVSNAFFVNLGTGTLTAGPDI